MGLHPFAAHTHTHAHVCTCVGGTECRALSTLGEAIEGTVFAYDSSTKMVVLEQPALGDVKVCALLTSQRAHFALL